MATNLVETIQKNLGYDPLQKIDPNIQETKDSVPRQSKAKLGQAAIPATLTALYKFTRTKEGCEIIVGESENADWLNTIFEGKEKIAVDKVAHYAGVTPDEAETAMENIANESIRILRKSGGKTPTAINEYMNVQRHHILVHLPAAMQLGDLLNDEALDDRTNKMEGPVSSFMHKIENSLSKGDESKYP